MELHNDYPAQGLEAGDVVGICTSTGVIYAPALSATVLLDALWPDEWSIVPPG